MSQEYTQAGKILSALLSQNTEDNKVSLKSLIYSKENKFSNIPTLQVLVTETLKYKRILDLVLNSTKILEQPSNKWLIDQKFVVYVMLYDLLISDKMTIRGGGRIKKVLMKEHNIMRTFLARLLIKEKAKNVSELIPEFLNNHQVLPRYVRINRLLTTPQEVIDQFISEGFQLSEPEEVLNNKDNKKIFAIDPSNLTNQPIEDNKKLDKKNQKKNLEKNILMFSALTDLHDHKLVLNGSIILQDKASMFSAIVLDVPQNSVVIDSCAAPGMKTGQLSESMKNTGTLYAFDKSKKRLDTLSRLTKRNGCTNIQAINQDFLTVDPTTSPYDKVEYILCDPSCSGSGIVSRMDELFNYAMKQETLVFENELNETTSDEINLQERLTNLSDFQLSIILQAFSFPNVKRVVYSTCSVHQTENEEVVLRALHIANGSFKLKKALPYWERRGEINVDETQRVDKYPTELKNTINLCAKTLPQEDNTIGFFVACFEKIGDFHSLSKERLAEFKKYMAGKPVPEKKAEEKTINSKPTKQNDDDDDNEDESNEDDRSSNNNPTPQKGNVTGKAKKVYKKPTLEDLAARQQKKQENRKKQKKKKIEKIKEIIKSEMEPPKPQTPIEIPLPVYEKPKSFSFGKSTNQKDIINETKKRKETDSHEGTEQKNKKNKFV